VPGNFVKRQLTSHRNAPPANRHCSLHPFPRRTFRHLEDRAPLVHASTMNSDWVHMPSNQTTIGRKQTSGGARTGFTCSRWSHEVTAWQRCWASCEERISTHIYLSATDCTSDCECLDDGFEVAGRRLSTDALTSVRKKEVSGASLLRCTTCDTKKGVKPRKRGHASGHTMQAQTR